MKYFFLTVLFFTFLTFSAQAQSKKKEKQSKKTEKAEQDNSYAPFSPAESAMDANTSSRKSKKSRKGKNKGESFSDAFNKRMDNKIVEFEKRMKQNAQDDRREARLMKKPQYSDPMYFGHKKPPKKRPLGKRKFCKECGIVH